MSNNPSSPGPFQWPPYTTSPDVVSWRNTDHLKYEFAPRNNPDSSYFKSDLQKELERTRGSDGNIAAFKSLKAKLKSSYIKKPAPVCDITHMRAFIDSVKKQTEPEIGKILDFYYFTIVINILYSTYCNI